MRTRMYHFLCYKHSTQVKLQEEVMNKLKTYFEKTRTPVDMPKLMLTKLNKLFNKNNPDQQGLDTERMSKQLILTIKSKKRWDGINLF